ncbi:MAG TPA: ABC transporter permease subunit [Gemmatimonadales bacterium]|nr:ABC transporter permease subunit [Gemmatimonadales bacterium]
MAPFTLLALWSVGGDWFYPALLPRSFTGRWWGDLLQDGRLLSAAATSLMLGAGTGILTCAAGLPVGQALSQASGWRRHAGAAMAFLPVAAPPIALAAGVQYSFLRLGLGGTLTGVLLAHAIPAIGYGSLFFLGVFEVFDRRVEDEARSLGASPRQVLVRVLLPLLRRPLADAFLLGFLVSWSQVPLTLLIGGGPVRTLPIEVFSLVRAGQDPAAATGALIMLIPALAALAATRLGAARTEVVAL